MMTKHDKQQTPLADLDAGISRIIDLARFSSLQRLLRITTYVLRFVKRCMNRNRYRLKPYKRNRYDKARRNSTGDEVLDIEDGIIRRAGRIHNAELDYNTNHPILLPKRHAFT